MSTLSLSLTIATCLLSGAIAAPVDTNATSTIVGDIPTSTQAFQEETSPAAQGNATIPEGYPFYLPGDEQFYNLPPYDFAYGAPYPPQGYPAYEPYGVNHKREATDAEAPVDAEKREAYNFYQPPNWQRAYPHRYPMIQWDNNAWKRSADDAEVAVDAETTVDAEKREAYNFYQPPNWQRAYPHRYPMIQWDNNAWKRSADDAEVAVDAETTVDAEKREAYNFYQPPNWQRAYPHRYPMIQWDNNAWKRSADDAEATVDAEKREAYNFYQPPNWQRAYPHRYPMIQWDNNAW